MLEKSKSLLLYLIHSLLKQRGLGGKKFLLSPATATLKFGPQVLRHRLAESSRDKLNKAEEWRRSEPLGSAVSGYPYGE